MNKKKSRMKFRGHGFSDSAHDPWVIPADAGHICASFGTVPSSHMGAGKMHQRLHHLSWASEEVQLELVGIFNDPRSVHTHAVIMELLKEQPNGSNRGSNSGLPRLVRSIARGWSR